MNTISYLKAQQRLKNNRLKRFANARKQFSGSLNSTRIDAESLDKRTVNRGIVSFNQKQYFSPELVGYHGKTVTVFDLIDDVLFVSVSDGRVIEAECYGNDMPYFPKGAVERRCQQAINSENLPEWALEFLGYFRLPQRLTVRQAYEKLAENWQPENGELPSIYEVCYVVDYSSRG